MSNESGNNTAPKGPVFAGPDGYASTRLEVKGSPAYVASQEKSYALTRKGYTPGTFVVKHSDGRETPVRTPSKPFDGIRDTRKEREELEAKLRAESFKIEIEKNQKEVLRKLPPLLLEYKEQSLESEKLRAKNLSGAIIKKLESGENEVTKIIEDLYENPHEDMLAQLLVALQDFEEAIHAAEEEAKELPSTEDLQAKENTRRDVIEKELIEKVKRADKKAELLQEMVNISVEFSTLKSKTEVVLQHLKDPSRSAVLMSLVEELENALLVFRSDPQENKIATLKQKIDELNKELQKVGSGTTSPEKKEEGSQLHQDILNLTFDVEKELEEARTLESQISEDAARKGFRGEVDRLAALFASLRRNPSQEAKKQFDQTFEEYLTLSKKAVEAYLRNHPKPASTTVVPSTPLASTTAAPDSSAANATDAVPSQPAPSSSPVAEPVPVATASDTSGEPAPSASEEDPWSHEKIREAIQRVRNLKEPVRLVDIIRDGEEKPSVYEIGKFNRKTNKFSLTKVPGGDIIYLRPHKLEEFLARQLIHQELKEAKKKEELARQQAEEQAKKAKEQEERSKSVEKKEEATQEASTGEAKEAKEEKPKKFGSGLFKPGSIVTVTLPEGTKEYRIIKSQDGIVTYFDLTNRTAGPRAIPEEELSRIKEKKRKKPSIQPLQELFETFNHETRHPVASILEWKRNWIDSGKLDMFRAQYNNVTFTEQQLRDAREALDLYIKVLEEDDRSPDALPHGLRERAIGNIPLAIRVLTGFDDERANDIQHLTKISLGGTSLQRVKEDMKSFKEGPSPSLTAQPAVEPVRVQTPGTEPIAAVTPHPITQNTATKQERAPLDVRSTWPRHIVHDSKKGWTYTRNGTSQPLLPTEEWNASEANIRPLFDEYFKFITEGSSGDQKRKIEFFSEVIILKNEIVGFLNEKDPISAQRYAETFRERFAEKRKEWEELKKHAQHISGLETLTKKHEAEVAFFSERLALLKKLLPAEEMKPLMEKFEDFEDSYQELRQHLELNRVGKEATYKKSAESVYAEEMKNLHQALLEKENGKEKELRALKKEGRERVLTQQEEKKTSTRRMEARRAVNRLIRTVSGVKIDDTNKDQTILLRGGRKMNLADYVAQNKAHPEQENTIDITDEILREWPELLNTYPVGASIEKRDFDDATRSITYERMFKRNAQAFIGTYTNQEIDKRTHKIRYTSNRRFQMGTREEREAIRAVLARHGLILEDESWQERRAVEEKKNEKTVTTAQAFKKVYSPAVAERKSMIEKEKKVADLASRAATTTDDKDVLKAFNKAIVARDLEEKRAGAPQPMAEYVPQKRNTIQNYQDLRTLRGRYARHEDFKGMEQKLDELSAKMSSEPNNEKVRGEFESQFALYEKAVTPFIEGRLEALTAYKSPAQQESLAKIEAIKKTQEQKNAVLRKAEEVTEKRIEGAIKRQESNLPSAREAGNGNIRKAILATLLGVNAMAYIPDMLSHKAEASPQKTEQAVEKGWRQYVASYAKALQKTMEERKSVRDIIAIHASKSINKDKPSSIDHILQLKARDVLTVDRLLGEEQQAELSDMLRAAENISQAVSAPATARATSAISAGTYTPDTERALRYSPPDDLDIPPHMTIEDYLVKIMKKVTDAGK